MGFLCAVFLLYLSEAEAFCMMKRWMIDFDMKGMYTFGFPKLIKIFYIHGELMRLWLPRLYSHLVRILSLLVPFPYQHTPL